MPASKKPCKLLVDTKAALKFPAISMINETNCKIGSSQWRQWGLTLKRLMNNNNDGGGGIVTPSILG